MYDKRRDLRTVKARCKDNRRKSPELKNWQRYIFPELVSFMRLILTQYTV